MCRTPAPHRPEDSDLVAPLALRASPRYELQQVAASRRAEGARPTIAAGAGRKYTYPATLDSGAAAHLASTRARHASAHGLLTY